MKGKRTSLLLALLMVVLGINARPNCFTVKQHKLIDANGKTFVIAGINNPCIWFKDQSFKAFEYIEQTGANTVRIVWATNGNAEELDRMIARCAELKMVPMVELHDVTGNSSKDRLVDMARYYVKTDILKVLKSHERYLLINIANEWGDHRVTSRHWLDSYSAAIKVLRDAGLMTTLVIDAPGWGQNIEPILESGRDLMDNDPLHNLLFSIHMYGSWNDPSNIKAKLEEAKRKKLPLIVGEFGYNFNEGKNNLGCKTSHTTILETCHKLGYGFIPWSWTGNNQENEWLDLVESKDWKTPTWWGNEVINGRYGIREIGKKTNVF